MTGGGASFLPVADDEETGGRGQLQASFVGEAGVRGPKWARMPLLTIQMLGLQIVWSVEMAWASPYLHDELGVKKSFIAIIFLAGPLSGLVVQPVIGVLADRSTSRFGRRRPFIAIGGFICVIGILILGYTKNVSGLVTKEGSSANHTLTVALAVFSIFCIDFSINAVMAADRALLVDTLPTRDQPLGNAWAGGMFALGSVSGFFLGSVNLPRVFPFLGDTQLKVLSAISAFTFTAVHALVASSVREQRLIKRDIRNGGSSGSVVGIFKDIWVNMRKLPYVIRQICITQFFAWFAWFPFLFYMTSYIGEVYTQSLNSSSPPTQAEADEGTRLGNRALLLHAITGLLTSVLAPGLVRERGKRKRFAICDLPTLWSISLLVLGVSLISTIFVKDVTGATIITVLLGTSWAITQWAPFALLGEAILSSSSSSSTSTSSSSARRSLLRGEDLGGGGGRSTASSFETIRFVDRRTESDEAILAGEERQFTIGDEEPTPNPAKNLDHDDVDSMEGPDRDEEEDDERDGRGREGRQYEEENPLMGNKNARMSVADVARDARYKKPGDDDDDEERRGGGDEESGFVRRRRKEGDSIAAKAGIILGIHNVALVIPQFLSTALASIVFKLYEHPRTVIPGPHPAPAQPLPSNSTAAALALALTRREIADDTSPDSLGVVFRIGGGFALVSFVIAWRLGRYLKSNPI